jgi:ribosome recycling factor
VAWTDEKKEQAVTLYEAQGPTPETSMEIVKEIADELEESPNGVRMILTRAGVYIKKAAAVKNGSQSTGGTGRVSKQAMQDELITAITDAGQPVDEDIISKLSGKAAQYLASVISSIN